LFRNTTAGCSRLESNLTDWVLGRSVVRGAIKDRLVPVRIGVAPEKYTRMRMLQGAVSAAIAGWAIETLFKLLFAHCRVSWQNYADVVKTDHRDLYHFADAIGL
jgi:hypothetical protein